MIRLLLPGLLLALLPAAHAAPVRYELDSNHTYPSFEFPHMGISVWRGKFNTTRGFVVLDREARTGTVEVVVDVDSIDFGHRLMNELAWGPDWLDGANHPTMRYVGKVRFEGETPIAVDGNLTLAGQTHPLELRILSFKCMRHPLFGREVCGADATGTLDRGDYGITKGAENGMGRMTLRIQAEGLRAP